MEIMIRNLVLFIGWPVLIGGSIYLYVRGHAVYQMVKGSLVGKVTKVLVVSMLTGMYSLGIVTTVLMFEDEKMVWLGLPIFLVWFATFVWSLRVLANAQAETKKLAS